MIEGRTIPEHVDLVVVVLPQSLTRANDFNILVSSSGVIRGFQTSSMR